MAVAKEEGTPPGDTTDLGFDLGDMEAPDLGPGLSSPLQGKFRPEPGDERYIPPRKPPETDWDGLRDVNPDFNRPPRDRYDVASAGDTFPVPDYQGSLEESRAAGYSWPEIQNHVSAGTLAAADAGYSQGEIDQHLGFADPTLFSMKAEHSWAAQMAADPKVLDGIAASEPSLDLSDNPEHRRAYADALLNGEVKGPRDFALRYAGAALTAAHDMHDLDAGDPDAVRARQDVGGQAANALTPYLPNREDLVDATLSLGSGDARERLMQNWADTGAHPIDAAVRKDDSPFGTNEKVTDNAPSIEDLAAPGRDAIEKTYFVPGEELPDSKGAADAVANLATDVATVAGFTLAGEGLKLAGKYVVLPLARSAIRTLGEIPEWLRGVAEKTPIDSVDFTKPPGEVNGTTTVAKALEAPPPAAREVDLGGGKTEALDVWHASPYEFDKFDTDKIGTGEGSQDEGHGLYFAENKAVHENYLQTLAPRMGDGRAFDAQNPEHLAAQELYFTYTENTMSGMSEAEANAAAVKGLRGYALNSPYKQLREAAATLIEKGEPLPDYMDTWVNSYQVKLHVNQDRIMHRDLSFNDQSPAVQKAMETVDKKVWTYEQEPDTRIAGDQEAGAWFDDIRDQVGDKEASDLLQKEGLQGLKYMDSGSKFQTPALDGSKPGADPTHNYVIFRDNRAQVTHINDIPFVPEATPAEKIASLSRQELMERLGRKPAASPTLFRDLAKDQDPETIELAAGADHTASWITWFRATFHDLLSDESGSLTLAGTPRQQRIDGKNYADELIRRVSTGLGVQRTEYVAQGFEPYFKALAPHMPRWEQEIAKGPGGAPMDTEIGHLINAMEGKGVVAPDSPMAPYARHRVEVNDMLKGALDERIADGRLNPIDYKEYYLHHAWTPESIGKEGGAEALSGRTGNLGYTRERTHATTEDGLAAGLDPLHKNPIIMDMANLDTNLKVIATVDMQQIARAELWMKYFSDPRKALEEGYGKPLLGLNSTKRVGLADGTVITHQLYGKPGFDTIWNNWVGFDTMQRSATFATIEDAMLKLKNGSTYLKLLFPGFHTVTEFKNGMANGVANGLTEAGVGLVRGDWKEMARGFRDIALSPIAAPINVWQAAAKWRPMYRAVEADPALDAFVAGGGNMAARSKVYSASDSPMIWKLWSRGQLGQAAKAEAERAFSFPAIRNDEGAGELAKDFGNLLAFPFRSAAYALSNVTAPIWDHGIPLLKAGAAIERMQTFMRQNPVASDAAMSKMGRQIVTNIEDRMGEYNTANLFWHPIIKRITNQAMLSTSWTYGTIHATLTGLGWNPGRGIEWNPTATTNLMGQLATIAFTNAAWGVIAAGKMPDSTLDYLIPFANARGLARVLLPGEEKEYHDWAKVTAETYGMYQDKGALAAGKQFLQGSAGYAVGKLAPIWQAAIDLMSETNRIGERLAFKKDGMLGWAEKVLLPIFALNWDKGEKLGLDPVSNLMGVREAPKTSAIFDPSSPEWRTFLAKQTKLHDMWSKQALSRENKEEGIEKPPKEYKGRAPRGSGSGFSPSNPWGR